MIHMPFDPEGMVRRLRSDQVWQVDVGVVAYAGQQRYFCNTLGMGLSAHVTCEAKKIRWLRGIPLYGLAALKAICRHFQSCPIQLTENGQKQDSHLLYLAVALGKAEGGGFVVAPDAKLDDGRFDVLHVTNLTRWRALGYLPRMITGNLPAPDEQIHRRQSTGLRILAERPLPMHTDGEVLASSEDGITECEIRLLPGRLKVRGEPVP
jgi:diacylglycerol kinase family enzyme